MMSVNGSLRPYLRYVVSGMPLILALLAADLSALPDPPHPLQSAIFESTVLLPVPLQERHLVALTNS